MCQYMVDHMNGVEVLPRCLGVVQKCERLLPGFLVGATVCVTYKFDVGFDSLMQVTCVGVIVQ